MNFNELPESAKLWVFPLDKPIGDTERFITEIKKFVKAWKAHGAQLKAEVELVDNQLLLVAVDEEFESTWGCSVDSLIREVSRQAGDAGLNVCAGGSVVFRSDNRWEAASRVRFQELISLKVVGGDTDVVDSTLTSVAELRSKGVVKPLRESWHSIAFHSWDI